MTTAIESQYHFTAAIQSKGKQQNRDGWAMVVDWKLPGSKFDLTLYGQDWETVQGFEVGETAIITINQGNLKKDKDGKYSTDYFWDMIGIEATWIGGDEAPPVQAPPKPNPAPAPPARTPAPNMEPPPNPAALGACHPPIGYLRYLPTRRRWGLATITPWISSSEASSRSRRGGSYSAGSGNSATASTGR